MLDVMLTTCWSGVTTNPEQEVPDPRVRPALTTWVTPPPPPHPASTGQHGQFTACYPTLPHPALTGVSEPLQCRNKAGRRRRPLRRRPGHVPALYRPCTGLVTALYQHCSSLPLTSPPKSAWNACGAAEWPRPVYRFQQTRYTDPMLVQCWASVADAVPTLNQHWFNAS